MMLWMNTAWMWPGNTVILLFSTASNTASGSFRWLIMSNEEEEKNVIINRLEVDGSGRILTRKTRRRSRQRRTRLRTWKRKRRDRWVHGQRIRWKTLRAAPFARRRKRGWQAPEWPHPSAAKQRCCPGAVLPCGSGRPARSHTCSDNCNDSDWDSDLFIYGREVLHFGTLFEVFHNVIYKVSFLF